MGWLIRYLITKVFGEFLLKFALYKIFSDIMDNIFQTISVLFVLMIFSSVSFALYENHYKSISIIIFCIGIFLSRLLYLKFKKDED